MIRGLTISFESVDGAGREVRWTGLQIEMAGIHDTPTEDGLSSNDQFTCSLNEAEKSGIIGDGVAAALLLLIEARLLGPSGGFDHTGPWVTNLQQVRATKATEAEAEHWQSRLMGFMRRLNHSPRNKSRYCTVISELIKHDRKQPDHASLNRKLIDISAIFVHLDGKLADLRGLESLSRWLRSACSRNQTQRVSCKSAESELADAQPTGTRGPRTAKANKWDANAGEEPLRYPAPTGKALTTWFTSGGPLLLAVVRQKQVVIWDTAGQEILWTLEGHTADILSASVSPNGQRLFTGDKAGIVRTWRLDSGREERVDGPLSGWVTGLSCSWNGDLLAASCGQSIHLVNVTPDVLVASSILNCRGVRCVGLSRYGNYLFAGGLSKRVDRWNVNNGQRESIDLVHFDTVTSVDCNAEGTVAVSGGLDQSVRIWDAVGANLKPRQSAAICIVRLDADGRYAAVGDADGGLSLWHLGLRTMVHSWTCGSRIRALAIEPTEQPRLACVTDTSVEIRTIIG